MNPELRRRQEFARAVEIGSDVWVGGAALIMPGVTNRFEERGRHGEVVTRDIPEGGFAAGNPCRVLRSPAS